MIGTIVAENKVVLSRRRRKERKRERKLRRGKRLASTQEPISQGVSYSESLLLEVVLRMPSKCQ